MKNLSIIHTDFVNDICFNLECTLWNFDIVPPTITHEWLFNNLNLAVTIVEKDIARINEELIALKDDEEPFDLYDELNANRKLLIALNILFDLETPYYADPKYISNSITILSEKLASQLEAKVNKEAHYNKYYCSRLAECLKELCTLI